MIFPKKTAVCKAKKKISLRKKHQKSACQARKTILQAEKRKLSSPNQIEFCQTKNRIAMKEHRNQLSVEEKKLIN